jgi:putative transposase
MNCPPCAATTTKKRAKKTKRGYTPFFCPHCRCTFNERTGTPFTYLEFPTDIVLLAVLWRLRSQLSLRDVADRHSSREFITTKEPLTIFTFFQWITTISPGVKQDQRIFSKEPNCHNMLEVSYTS